MLGSEYALKYSMPHSVVHIIDNSMYTGQLPVTVADDPSLYSTLVVTGAPMGADNEIVPINRSDVLNVAYGMNDLSPSDIKKFGQTVTYPTSILSQNAPIKFMRVTPEDSTYAFSCLLVQWRWDGSTMHVRFKTTTDDGSNGLPAGVIHSSFKNTARLNSVLVNMNKEDGKLDPSDRTIWTQRTFMTFIAAGRGAVYNNFNYSINLTNQTRRPANTRYLFSTIDTRISQVSEQFFASLINENNNLRSDAIETVNVAVGKRVKGSSILVPTVNEEAIKELYAEYMEHMKEMIDNDIPPAYGMKDMEFVETVYKTMNINIFEPIYGRYIYNGDSDVRLPYYQVDMVDLDIPRLATSNQVKTYLGEETVSEYRNNPYDIQSILNTKTFGIMNETDTYHVGDVFCNAPSSLSLSMITSINQYSGSVTTIPINRIKINTAGQGEDPVYEYYTIKAYATEKKDVTDGDVAAIQDLVDRRKLVPTATDTGYANDFVIVGLNETSQTNGLPKFEIVKVAYTVGSNDEITVSAAAKYTTAAEIYPILVYPASNVTSFCEDSSTESEYRYAPGTTVVYTGSESTGEVRVNSYNSKKPTEQDPDANVQFTVVSPDPFVVGPVPKKVVAYSDMVGTAYDNMIYGSDISVKWQITGGTGAGLSANGYAVGDIVKLVHNDQTTEIPNMWYIVTAVKNIYNDQNEVIRQDVAVARFRISLPSEENKKIWAGTFPVDGTTSYYLIDSSAVDFDPKAHKKFDETTQTFVAGTDADPAGTSYYDEKTTSTDPAIGTGLEIIVDASNITATTTPAGADPTFIQRYNITGTTGSLFRYQLNNTEIPTNYYSPSYGENPNSEFGGLPVENGYAGFFDDNISEIEFKWRYSNLLVKAYRGELDPRITSPTRCPAKYLFDGGTNTIVGQTIIPYMQYKPIDIINASTIYTDDEKEAILLNSDLIANITEFVDVDVKQAMYDLMIQRVYQGIPEDKRPIGPGSGLSLHLDAGVTDANTATLVNQSFNKRFNNPNASWDIGGYVSTADGISYTYIKRLVDNMFAHMRRYSVNKPFTGKYSNIGPTEYSSFFPDIDTTDWELRELLYGSGGNAWIMDINGNLQRQSQRTLYRENGTSDLIQESNMRTLSQLVYLLQNKINSYLLEYNDDGVLATLKDEVDNMFSNWVGNTVQDLEIIFKRDINPTDGGEIVVCYVNVTFRGLILRVPIIVNVQRRTTSE